MKSRACAGILIASLSLGGCETILSDGIEKSAQGDELRRETALGVALPAGCPVSMTTVPPGKTKLTVSYREPNTNQTGAPLESLAYTTIYVTSAQEPPKAIRIWTNDPRGGALVTIHDVAVPTGEIGFCVTATNWARKESAPAGLAAHRPSP